MPRAIFSGQARREDNHRRKGQATASAADQAEGQSGLAGNPDRAYLAGEAFNLVAVAKLGAAVVDGSGQTEILPGRTIIVKAQVAADAHLFLPSQQVSQHVFVIMRCVDEHDIERTVIELLDG